MTPNQAAALFAAKIAATGRKPTERRVRRALEAAFPGAERDVLLAALGHHARTAAPPLWVSSMPPLRSCSSRIDPRPNPQHLLVKRTIRRADLPPVV